MKKHLFIKWTVTLGIAALTVSCFEDKGHYDYVEINEVTISGIEERYEISVGEPLNIMPVLSHTIQGLEEDYQYLWLNIGNGKYTYDTLYRERYIENTALSKLILGNNRIVYQVIDPVRNVKYTSDYFTINVANDIRHGFLLLFEDEEGKTDLKFLNYFTTHNYGGTSNVGPRFELRDVPTGDLPELGKPIAIDTYADGNAPGAGGNTYYYAISLITETGFYKLHPLNFAYTDAYNGRYFILGNMDELKIADVIPPAAKNQALSQVSAMIRTEEGNFMFYRYGSLGTPGAIYFPWMVGTYCNRYVIDENNSQLFRPFKHFGYMMNMSAVFYDLDSKSYAFKAGTKNDCEKFAATTPAIFPLNDTPFDPLWMFMRQDNILSGTTRNMVLTVGKDRATGDINLYAFFASVADAPNYQYMHQLSGLANIKNAKHYAMNNSGAATDWRSLFFYGTDSEVYVYDLIDKTSKKVFTADAGQSIIRMEIVANNLAPKNANNAFVNHMVIVTEGSARNSTTVGLYEVTAGRGDLTLKQFKHTTTGDVLMDCKWEGLPKFVDFDWKSSY